MKRSGEEAFNFRAFLYADKQLVDAQQILATACRMEKCSAVRLDLIGARPEPQTWASCWPV